MRGLCGQLAHCTTTEGTALLERSTFSVFTALTTTTGIENAVGRASANADGASCGE